MRLSIHHLKKQVMLLRLLARDCNGLLVKGTSALLQAVSALVAEALATSGFWLKPTVEKTRYVKAVSVWLFKGSNSMV
ncbi:hypothetical protein DITRI_Ditri14bG0087400 [Diplodiscus trichospermus]